jgi:hypothetical protein
MFDGELWEDKYKNNPITEKFLKLFGGYFQIDPEDDTLYYEDEKMIAYKTPEDEITFWNMVSESVKQEKNLFLNQPKY